MTKSSHLSPDHVPKEVKILSFSVCSMDNELHPLLTFLFLLAAAAQLKLYFLQRSNRLKDALCKMGFFFFFLESSVVKLGFRPSFASNVTLINMHVCFWHTFASKQRTKIKHRAKTTVSISNTTSDPKCTKERTQY